ncbi:ECF subfamily RNA polymerase sigma factor, BldN family [Chloroflexus sp.]|uniref:ECF subfamily RNA polymerase sigma factor, BldN family n=1 Tax=Chloroflexus sp. TaxID=1904827 RepID=UPI00261E9259|nr:ECF subfamily RNA polymerase sigma factor, BldN family [uncultured Chloroflexus sp.]
MLDDAELLSRACALETDALAAIHDAYYQPLYRYISFRVSDHHTCEDLVSEVFSRFLKAIAQRTAPRSNLRGWLFKVAANVVSDHYRRAYRAPSARLDERMVSQEPEPAEVAEQIAVNEELRRAISHLTDEQQQVLALRFGQNLPVQEVARILGKTEGAVKQLQLRAIAALARHLTPGMVE